MLLKQFSLQSIDLIIGELWILLLHRNVILVYSSWGNI